MLFKEPATNVFTMELAHQQPEFPLKKRADEPNNEILNEILIEELRKNLKNNAYSQRLME
ncbi:hypothetical protein OROHE_023538 [Orobanche hederae]